MSNTSNPKCRVGTVKSLLRGYFSPGYRPSGDEIREAIRKRGRGFNIHRDGRLFAPYQRHTPQKKIGKGNGLRV